MTILNFWKRLIDQLKIEVYALYLVYKDPRVPWYAKVLIVFIVGYVLSPIDQFLDSIPMIGYLDHLILVPIGVVLAFKKMVPPAVLTDSREKAHVAMDRKKPASWGAGFITIFILFLFTSLGIVFTTWVTKDWNAILKWWFTKRCNCDP